MQRLWLHTLVLALVGAGAAACARPAKPAPGAAAPNRVAYDTDPVARRTPSERPDIPFFTDTPHDPALLAPDACLGHAVGARLATPEAIVRCFHLWAEASVRARVATYAHSHEGRELVRVVISSPENLDRLDQILADLARLADPRGLTAADARRIIADTPAVGWFGYSIHGDEVSGADASLAFGYHLIAGQGAGVTDLLDRVVVVIDPVMNPDGRARTVSQVEQSASLVPNLDDASMHRGRWPWGRGNHYLFDMNRDWLAGVAPETRGRWQGLLAFHPQLVVDAHEMGPQETYLFYPYAEPINPHLAPTLARWQQAFAADQSRAFDAHGWAYYTREWADGWYPGYTDAWAGLTGAVGMLYEQASTKGQSLLRRSGQRVTYRESVHAQAVSSLANLGTLARNRQALLEDYLAYHRAQVQPEQAGRAFAGMFVIVPGRVPDREHALLAALLRQGVEVYRADAGFEARNAESALGQTRARLALPAGSYLVPATQPRGALVRSALGFDTRFDAAFLQREREALERGEGSKIYDLTAWNLGQAFALDTYWIDAPRVARTQMTTLDARPAGMVAPANGQANGQANLGQAYAWVVDGRDDASATFAVQALERGLIVHVADEAFRTAGRDFARGSLLLRAGENADVAGGATRGDDDDDIAARVREAAEVARVQVYATRTGRSPADGPDLGGNHFRLLSRPRVAVLSNAPVRPESFGHIWYQLDQELRVPMSMLDVQHLGGHDLRRYSVLVIPPAGPGLGAALAPHAERIAAWVRSGGTLIAVGGEGVALASKGLGLSQVRLRREVLGELALYRSAARRDQAARAVTIDEAAVWQQGTPGADSADSAAAGEQDAAAAGKGEADAEDAPVSGPVGEALAQQRDAWMRRFAPQGAMLRALVDTRAWLTFGMDQGEMPVLVMGDQSLMAPQAVRVPVRLAEAARLRLAGLLWPEARARLAESAYATVEPVGAGQIILFASPPSFRGVFRGTARLLSNAIVYGPSLGASQPLRW